MFNSSLSQVRSFWDANPCGAQFTTAPFGTPAFFREHAEFRYRTEWHLNEVVPYDAFRDRDVLEIGCGLGADGARFAQSGARYTGVDLTPTAVDATRLRFQALGLPGRFLVENAEKLASFEDASFDLVYSHGVLHHTENTELAFAQVHRVLRPGGQAILMLYHKASFNYYVRILAYLRVRVALYAAARHLGAPPGKMEPHYRQLQQSGLRYLSAEKFVHHCTDGPECPIARTYTRAEARILLEPYFKDLRFRTAHFPLTKALGSFPRPIEDFLARRLGWYLFIYGTKRD